MKRQKSYAERSIIAWMLPNETNEQAKARLAALWKQGKHPAQLQKKERV